MHIALQMDALSRLNKRYDSTLYLAKAAALRGYQLFHYEPQHLYLDIVNGSAHLTAAGHTLSFDPKAEDPWALGEPQSRSLTDFDVVLMRQDPPFDLAYITATHLLELINGAGAKKTRVINDPIGVRNAPEKLLITHFPHLLPPTLITRDRKAIEDFRAVYGDIILKPLHGHAGHGIFHLRAGDNNLPSLLEMLREKNNEPWMIQKYLPVTTLGDKRIVMLEGEPVGSYRRLPAEGDIRGNTRVGARVEAAPLTKRDLEICAVLAPVLRARGLFLAGIDVIGDYLTEINVTSPTGLVVADEFAKAEWKDSIAEKFWAKLAP